MAFDDAAQDASTAAATTNAPAATTNATATTTVQAEPTPVCAGGGLCVVVRVWVCFGAFLCVRVFVFLFVCLCLCVLVVCLCLPSLRLVCVSPLFECVLRFRFLLCFLVRFLVF